MDGPTADWHTVYCKQCVVRANAPTLGCWSSRDAFANAVWRSLGDAQSNSTLTLHYNARQIPLLVQIYDLRKITKHGLDLFQTKKSKTRILIPKIRLMF